MATANLRFAANYAVVRSALTASLAAKPSREQVLVLAGRAASMLVSDATVSMSGPVVATKYPDRNTSVTLTAKAGSGYKGSIELHYNRVPIANYFPNPEWLLPPVAAATTVHALLPAINAAYGVNIATSEVVDHPVLANTTTAVLEVVAGSYVFQEGSRFTFATPLSKAVATRQTKGFYPNNPYEDQTIFDLMFEPTQSDTMLIDRKGNYAFSRYTGTGAVEVDPADGLQGLNLKGNGLFQAPYDATTMNPNAQDFTIEARIKVPSITPQRFPIFNRLVTSSTSGSFAFGLVQGKLDFLWTTNGTNSTSRRVTAAAALQPNREYDVSVSRNGSVIRIYVDGVLVGSATSVTTIWVGPSNLFIGGDTGSGGTNTYAGTGWIKALRYTLGVGRYPEAYSPKNIPLVARVLKRQTAGFISRNIPPPDILLQFKNGSYANTGPLAMTPAASSSMSVVAGAGRFEGGGLRNNGTVSLGALTYSLAYDLNDSYTVEWFQRKINAGDNVSNVNQIIAALEGTAGGNVGFQYYSASIYVYQNDNTAIATIPCPWPADANHHHIALSVDKPTGLCKLFFDGKLLGQFTSAKMNPLATMTRLRLTNLSTVNVALSSFYLSEFAITKGVAKYTEPFTPPVAPLL
jgi:hypothetical protein